MAPTLKTLAAVLVLACGAWGCSSDRSGGSLPSPTPTVVQAPQPTTFSPLPAPAGELWRLSTSVESLEGSACFWTHAVGTRFDNWTMSVDREGSQVRFVYDVNNPHDNVLLTGTVTGTGFTAESEIYRSMWACSGAVTITSSVAGSFSGDGRALSGRQRLIYRGSDSELIITLRWSASPI